MADGSGSSNNPYKNMNRTNNKYSNELNANLTSDEKPPVSSPGTQHSLNTEVNVLTTQSMPQQYGYDVEIRGTEKDGTDPYDPT